MTSGPLIRMKIESMVVGRILLLRADSLSPVLRLTKKNSSRKLWTSASCVSTVLWQLAEVSEKLVRKVLVLPSKLVYLLSVVSVMFYVTVNISSSLRECVTTCMIIGSMRCTSLQRVMLVIVTP